MKVREAAPTLKTIGYATEIANDLNIATYDVFSRAQTRTVVKARKKLVEKLNSEGLCPTEIEKQTGVCRAHVYKILRRTA
jgi:hypothetical protein